MNGNPPFFPPRTPPTLARQNSKGPTRLCDKYNATNTVLLESEECKCRNDRANSIVPAAFTRELLGKKDNTLKHLLEYVDETPLTKMQAPTCATC